MHHASKVSHLNELVMSTTATEDHYDNNGKLTFKKGQKLKTGVNGLNAYVKEVLIKKLKLDPQAAYAFQSDLSDISQENNWLTFAQTVGVDDKTGEFFQRTREQAYKAVLGESNKMDYENFWRRTNRGGFTEEEWVDDEHPELGRRSVLTPVAVSRIFQDYAGLSEKNIPGRFNKNLAENFMTKENWKILLGIGNKTGWDLDPKVDIGKDDNKFFGTFLKKIATMVDAVHGEDVSIMVQNYREISKAIAGKNLPEGQQKIEMAQAKDKLMSELKAFGERNLSDSSVGTGKANLGIAKEIMGIIEAEKQQKNQNNNNQNQP